MSWTYKNISLGTSLSSFIQDLVAGLGFGADVDLPSDPVTTGTSQFYILLLHNPYPTALPYGNGMVLHFYQQQESSTTKTVHKVINKGLKTYV